MGVLFCRENLHLKALTHSLHLPFLSTMKMWEEEKPSPEQVAGDLCPYVKQLDTGAWDLKAP